MIPFLISNWRSLIPSTAAIALGLLLGFKDIELAHLREADAKALAQATESARAQEAKNASTAQEIEVAHNERAKAIDDAFDANRELARTRGLYVRVKSSCLPKSATNPSSIIDGTVEARLSDRDGEFLTAFARDCAKDRNIAITGHDWAPRVGRP